MFSCAHLSRYVLLITQPGGVGVLSSNAVHGVVYLRSCPAVHLERRGYPLKRVSLDPVATNRKRENTEKGINSVFLFSHNLGSLSEVCFFANSSDIAKIRTNERGKPHSHFILLRFFFLIV